MYKSIIRKNVEKFLKLISNRTVQILLVIFIFALVLRLLCFGMNPLIGLLIPDVIYFLLLGENLAHGVGFTRFGAPEDKIPPIYPGIIAVSYFFGEITYQNAILPSVLIGSLLVIPVYFLGYKLYNQQVGYIVALFVASNPILWLFSGIPMSEMTFTFLSTCALYFLSIKRSKRHLFLGGVFTGLSYLCRYNGILILIAYSGIILHTFWKKRQTKASFLEFLQYIAGFLIIISPWCLWNTIHFGNPMPTGYSTELWEDPNIAGLPATYTGAENIVDYLRTHSFSQILLRFGSGLFYYLFISFFAFPVTLLIFAIPGFYYLRKEKKMYPIYLYLSLYIIFFAWWPYRYPRFLVPLIPLVSIPAAAFIMKIITVKNKWMRNFPKRTKPTKYFGVFIIISVVSINSLGIILLYSITANQSDNILSETVALTPIYGFTKDRLEQYRVIPSPAAEEYVNAAYWLRDYAGKGSQSVVAARKPLVFYYFSRLKTVSHPDLYANETLREVIQRSNVSYIVLDSMFPESRESFPNLYFERKIPENFRLIYKVENPRTLIYYIE